MSSPSMVSMSESCMPDQGPEERIGVKGKTISADAKYVDQERLESMLGKYWEAGSSKIEGYNRFYELETDQGDQIRVDFNMRRSMVRLAVTVAREKHRQYIAVIKSGTILQEKDFLSRRSLDLHTKISPLRRYFDFLPDGNILRALGGAYGLPTHTTAHPRLAHPILTARRALRVEGARFSRFLNAIRSRRGRTFRERVRDRLASELFFSLPVLGAAAGYYLHAFNMAGLALVLGALGLVSGAFEWIVLRKDPFLPRVTALVLAAGAVVHTEIQYRIYGLFL